MGALINGVQKAGRIGPLMVSVLNAQTQTNHQALIMGMTIPDSSSIYLTLNANQSFFDFLTVGDFQDTRLLDEKQFEAAWPCFRLAGQFTTLPFICASS